MSPLPKLDEYRGHLETLGERNSYSKTDQGRDIHADEGGRDAQRSDETGVQCPDSDGEPVHHELRNLPEADGLGHYDTRS